MDNGDPSRQMGRSAMHYVLIYTNEADRLAAKIPGAKYGTIEVRPVLELTWRTPKRS
jgi:hypothetical protein